MGVGHHAPFSTGPIQINNALGIVPGQSLSSHTNTVNSSGRESCITRGPFRKAVEVSLEEWMVCGISAAEISMRRLRHGAKAAQH